MTALLLILVFLLFQTFVLLCCVAAGNDAASQEISDQEQMEFIQGMEKKYIAQALKNKGLLQCADKPSTSHNSHIVLLFLLIYKKALFHQDRRS